MLGIDLNSSIRDCIGCGAGLYGLAGIKTDKPFALTAILFADNIFILRIQF